MKKLLTVLSIFLMVLFFSLAGTALVKTANATLHNSGGGLIYDDVLDITWLQDANHALTSGYHPTGFMTWDEAMKWADQLTYQGHTHWRLPYTIDGEYDYSFNGTTNGGYNNTTSELGYMYYINLENLAVVALDGTYFPKGWGLQNTGDFINLGPYDYWSGTRYSLNSHHVWNFYFYYGTQNNCDDDLYSYAWAVHDGNLTPVSNFTMGPAPVPEPATLILLGTGLIGLAGLGRRKIKGPVEIFSGSN